MSISVSASSNALSYLQSLIQQGMSGAGDATASDPLSLLLSSESGSPDQSAQACQSGASQDTSAPPFGPHTLGALLSAQGQNPQAQFASLDGDGDGQVSKSELETTLGQFGVSASDADKVFSKLDANGDGSVTQSEFDSAKTGHAHGRQHHAGAGGAQGSGQGNSSGATTNADGSTTQTTSNPDGSTTTVTTYPDGTTMTSTSQATQAASQSSATAANTDWANLMQALSQLQTQFTDPSTNLFSTIA